MAEGTITSLIGEFVCCIKYYNYNECPRGDLCPYNHIRGTDTVSCRIPRDNKEIGYVLISADSPAVPNLKQNHLRYCYFYARGYCHYGASCKYPHRTANIVDGSRPLTTTRSPTRNSSYSINLPSTSTSHSPIAKETQNIIPKLNEDNMTNLTAKNQLQLSLNLPHTITSGALNKEDWVNAPEFVPKNTSSKQKSYAEIVNPVSEQAKKTSDSKDLKLCPYAENDGVCKFPVGECAYLHGDICDLCGRAVLHPHNEELRKKHTQECISQHERNMEHSFAIARSREKTCGVCFEVIMEKSSGEQRFGILPNCNHCFCLTCIRKWRQARQFENKIIRACPECRVTSDFVCPSMYWVETKEEKEKLIEDYKQALSKKNCKYFKMGLGKCPFGNKCFYLHAYRDGTVIDVGPPPRQRRHCQAGNIEMLQHIILWDFLEERENHWLYSLADDLEELVAFFSDSDDSDWSDYELFFD